MESIEIIREKGRGAYSVVYKARVKDTEDKIVALKRYEAISAAEGIPLQALREIQCLKSVNSPNVIKLYDIFSIENPLSLNIILDYCKYSLDYILHSGIFPKLPLRYIKMIFKQIVDGVAAIHSSNILHRDLKPANILITKDNIVKISDFGISRFHRDDVRYSGNVVTLPYRAPEALLHSKYDFSIDIWSLGCILYELFTGNVMFFQQSGIELNQLKCIFNITGTDNDEIIRLCKEHNLDLISHTPSVLDSYLQDISKISQEAANLIKKMISLDPKSRPDISAVLNDPFLADSEKSTAFPPIKSFHAQ